MFVTHGKNIVYERDDELSDEEIYAKRLDRTLASLKLGNDSILGLQAALKEEPSVDLNFDIQLIELADAEITARFLKKGTPKAPTAEPEPKRPEEHKDMEISDDEVEIQPVVG